MICVQRKNLDTSISALRYRLASEGVVVSVAGPRAGSVREIVDRAIARTGVKTGRYCVIRRRRNLRSGDDDPSLGVIIYYRIVMSDGSGVAGDAGGDIAAAVALGRLIAKHAEAVCMGCRWSGDGTDPIIARCGAAVNWLGQ